VITTTSLAGDYVRECNSGVEVSVIPQGVDLERASRTHRERIRSEVLGALSLPSDTIIVGYHAPVICLSSDDDFQRPEFRTFDVDALIAAVSRLWADNLPFVTVLVGRTSRTIDDLAEEEHRLVLSGYVDRDQLYDWVSAFDIGVYPRAVDFGGRQSVKLLEYMANGAAIVAMRTSETTFLEENAAGYLASNDVGFFDLLRRLITARDERAALSSRGRTFVADHDWEALAEQYNRILETAAGAG
jgi:glycosyltransferase involved in cell wall biosynthesis